MKNDRAQRFSSRGVPGLVPGGEAGPRQRERRWAGSGAGVCLRKLPAHTISHGCGRPRIELRPRDRRHSLWSMPACETTFGGETRLALCPLACGQKYPKREGSSISR